MRSIDVEAFAVDSVMVHDVPRTGTNQTLLLTDLPITLDADLRTYFTRKIKKSIGDSGLDVLADPTGDSVVRAASAAILADAASLIAESQRMASRLESIQDQRNSAGLLAVVHGSLGSERCVAILKLEREEGLRVLVRSEHGRRTIDMQHLRDLTLTDKTKVFKTAILTQQGAGGDANGVEGCASDDQRSMRDGTGVATFFLSRFLGCKLRVNPAVATRDFFSAVEAFVNDDIASPEKRARYHVSLLSAMDDQQLDLQPRKFAEHYLDPIDRPAALERLTTAGLAPGTVFQKDLSLIEKRIRGFRIVFDSGMVLIGGKDDLEERVAVRPNNGDNPGADIKDTIKKLGGR